MLTRVFVSLFMVAFIGIGCSKDDESDEFHLPDESLSESDQEKLSDEILQKGEQVQARGWMIPEYSQVEIDAILKYYDYVDMHGDIPKNLLKNALLYYHKNHDLLDNKDTIAIVDFSKHSRKERFFIIEMRPEFARRPSQFHVSHGKGSDKSHSGYATKFSNIKNTEMSSLGFYISGETYSGKHGYSRRLDGVSKTNSLVRERAIVIHGAKYVVDSDVRQGRSQGCLAFSMANRKHVIDTLVEGTLIYVGRSRYD